MKLFFFIVPSLVGLLKLLAWVDMKRIILAAPANVVVIVLLSSTCGPLHTKFQMIPFTLGLSGFIAIVSCGVYYVCAVSH